MKTGAASLGVGTLLRSLYHFGEEEQTDGQLLKDFLVRRDESAFAALVRRHGPMVFRVCRRVLGNASDAEDAFQAVFLVLARKAAALAGRPVVGDWLHGVARRTALCARRADARRRAREQTLARPNTPAEESRNDWLPLLDEEVGRLPPRYRQAVVLCDLEGRTRKEAARHLGIPEGTVATRLTRARSLLARRLTRRGVVISGAALAAALAGEAAPTVAASVVAATARTAACFSAGQGAASLIPARVAAITEGVLKAMWFGKLRRFTTALLLVGLVALGAGLLGYYPAFGQTKREAGDPATLRLTPETAAPLGIRTTAAEARGGLPRVLREVGTINYDTDRLYMVRPRFPGEVVEITGIKDAERTRTLRYGDRVKKGQLLAVLWSKDLGEKKAALVVALCKLHLSREAVERLRKLADDGAVPIATLKSAEKLMQVDTSDVLTAERTLRMWKLTDAEIQELKNEAEQILKNAGKRDAKNEAARWARVEVRAPADGTVVEKNTAVGELHDPIHSPALFKIADLRRLQIWVRPPEVHLPRILEILKSGKRLKWHIRFPDEAPNTPPLELSVLQIASGPDDARARLVGYLDNPEGKYVIGQFVTADIQFPSSDPKKPAPPNPEVIVPASALVEQGGATFVLVHTDPTKLVYEARRVLVARRGNDVVHLRARLTDMETRRGFQTVLPGERVVTAGAIELMAALDDQKAEDKRR